MRIAIVSDAHLHDPHSARQREFVGFVDGLEADRLILLGDIFHAWGGFAATSPVCVGPALKAFRRLRGRGVPVTFVPGNHELRAGSLLEEQLAWTVREAHLDDAPGGRVLFAHGDEADTRAGYRGLRRLLRSPLFTSVLDRLGPDRAQALLDRLAGDAEATMARDPVLVDLQRRWARRHLDGAADVVMLGHSHVAGLVESDSGLIVHTGAWAGLRTWVLLDDAGVRLMQHRNGADQVLERRSWT